MTANRWESLLNEIEIIERPIEWVPSTEQLDEYERETGFRLPASYREFVQLFGGGTLAGTFVLWCPGYGAGRRVDLLTTNQKMQKYAGDEDLEEYCDNPEFFRRMHFFGQAGENEENFGWDPAEVTADGEYAVYVFYRSMKIERIAEGFEEFVRHICLGPGYFTFYGIETWENRDPQNSFEPE